MRVSASSGRNPSKFVGMWRFFVRFTLRTMRGGLPSSTLMSMSIGRSAKCSSSRTSWPSPVATPMKATGQRSRAQSASKKSLAEGLRART